MVEKFLAKSALQGGTALINHSIAVTNFSNFIFENIISPDVVSTTDVVYKDIRAFVISAAAMHDIGKCCSHIQKYLKCSKPKRMLFETADDGVENVNFKGKKKRGELLTHNVIGWGYLKQHTSLKECVLSGILSHHVVYNELMDYSASEINAFIEQDEINVKAFNEFFNVMSDYLLDTFGIEINMDESDSNSYVKDVLISYDMAKATPNAFEQNSLYTIVRSILIYADRMVSGHYTDNDRFIANDKSFMEDILYSSLMARNMPEDNVNALKDKNGNFVYNQERLISQNELLANISQHNTWIVGASAGYGKTLVGLRWAMASKQRALWVVPRNVIARGTYDSIMSEVEKMGYKDELSVGLLLGNYFEEGDESSDIIVTNIDNFLSPLVKNNEGHTIINMLNSNVIFDEYHEFLSGAPLFSGFISMVYTRTHFTNSKTLLMSASPLHFERAFWNDSRDYEYVHFIRPDAFNGEMEVNVSCVTVNDIRELSCNDKDSFIICNTVKLSQNCFATIDSDDKILIHSRFTKKDRANIEKKIYQHHDKYSDVNDRNTVVGTNIIGVGLDVSAKNIYDFVISPENTIQRGCGRGGRFGEKEYKNEINYYVCTLNNNAATKRLVTETFSQSLSNKWLDILQKHNGKKVTKNQIYSLYDEFYEENKKEVETLWLEFFSESCAGLKVMKPFHCRRKTIKDKEKTKLTSGMGFRGNVDNVFVTAKIDRTDELSEPITIMKVLVDGQTDEFKKLAAKERYKYMSKMVENFNYIYGDYYAFSKEEALKFATSSETPLLLCYSSYDSIFGLKMNNALKDACEDDTLD